MKAGDEDDFWNLEIEPLRLLGCISKQIAESFFQSRIGKYLFTAMPQTQRMMKRPAYINLIRCIIQNISVSSNITQKGRTMKI
ncbi:MAG: hypothetical protein NTW95_12440 [Candidatus Aminicenantes bacterium]|nr:hypothetical protein [Candidatus Aminicenantes bacterium]